MILKVGARESLSGTLTSYTYDPLVVLKFFFSPPDLRIKDYFSNYIFFFSRLELLLLEYNVSIVHVHKKETLWTLYKILRIYNKG